MSNHGSNINGAFQKISRTREGSGRILCSVCDYLFIVPVIIAIIKANITTAK